ncbi:MAG: GYD domain-containing protein [Terracidiphilus sp.]
MTSYLVQVAYTPEAVGALIAKPQDRTEMLAKMVRKLGGRIKGFWMSFGDYDVVGLIEAPDNIGAAAFSLAIAGGGSCKAVKTTPLLSIREGAAALRKAKKSGYRPIGAK